MARHDRKPIEGELGEREEAIPSIDARAWIAHDGGEIVTFPVARIGTFKTFQRSVFARQDMRVSDKLTIETRRDGGEALLVGSPRRNGDGIIAALLPHDTPRVTEDNFDREYGDRVLAVAVVDVLSARIEYIDYGDDYAAKRRLLDALRRLLAARHGRSASPLRPDGRSASPLRPDGRSRVWISVDTRMLNFKRALHFLATYGFVDARVDVHRDPSGKADRAYSVIMRYKRRVSIDETVARTEALVVGMSNDVYTLQLFMPKSVAETLSNYLFEPVEYGGQITIDRYDEEGVAHLHIYTDRVVAGDGEDDRVSMPPSLLAPINFHTHPQPIMDRHADYIAFPSGRDIASVIDRYVFYVDELVEFIASPEGVWFVHLTVAFQRILLALKSAMSRSAVSIDCAQMLIDDAAELLSFYAMQKRSNYPIERLNVDEYAERVSGIKLSRIFADRSPDDDIVSVCQLGNVVDTNIVDVGFIAWSAFDELGGVRMAFSYVVDAVDGLPAVIISEEEKKEEENIEAVME
jgi:hypothetical protein